VYHTLPLIPSHQGRGNKERNSHQGRGNKKIYPYKERKRKKETPSKGGKIKRETPINGGGKRETQINAREFTHLKCKGIKINYPHF